MTQSKGFKVLAIIIIGILVFGWVDSGVQAESLGPVLDLSGIPQAPSIRSNQPGQVDAWSWVEGQIVYTYVTDWTGTPYVRGFGAWVGYYQNAEIGQPAVNSIYYVNVSVYGINSPQAGTMNAYMTFHLPPSTSLAITAEHPIFSYHAVDGVWTAFTYTSSLQLLAPGHYAIPSGDPGLANAWPLAAGAGWEFQIPFTTATTLNASNFVADIMNIDAYHNPQWLYPYVQIYVWPAAVPGAFNKSGPSNGASNQSTSPTLSWGTSSGASSYEYCFNTTTSCVEWLDNGTATSKALSGLSAATTYYWHVRAKNNTGTTYSNGSASAFWSFSTAAAAQPPGAFNKSGPSNGASNQSTSPTLSWGTSSGVSSYEYCYNTTSSCVEWLDNGTATSKALSGLSAATTYYWHVRAKNNTGTTYSNGSASAFWSFTTAAAAQPPGAFNKSSPSDGTSNLSTSPTLSWESSNGATSYEYCYNTTASCDAWLDNGTATSKVLSGLSEGTPYYWHVRAKNNAGTTYANGSSSAFWSFTTSAPNQPPGAFNKSIPSNGAGNVSTSPTLSWGTSSGATDYGYCLSITPSCTIWMFNSTAHFKNLTDLMPNTNYFWQVKANNANGTTYANGSLSAMWSFKTGASGENKNVYLPIINK